MGQLKLKTKKGQVAAEFLFIMGFLIIVFIGFIILSIKIGETYISTTSYLNAREECLKFSNIVGAVQSGGPGTEVNLKSNYIIIFDNSSITIKDVEDRAVCNYHSNSIFSEVTRNINIININGEVIVTNETT